MANIKKRMQQNVELGKKAHEFERTQLEIQMKQEKRKHTTKYIVKAGIIAAVYIAITLALSGISYGMIQFRISEALVALIFFEPAAFPGVCIGCFVANLFGPGSIYDSVLGTCATGFGIYIMKWYCERNGKAPIGLLLYSFFNAFLVALELSYLEGNNRAILIMFAWVMLGESACAVGLGSLIYYSLRKRWKDIIGETKASEAEEFHPGTL